jgi:hypothetical protein
MISNAEICRTNSKVSERLLCIGNSVRKSSLLMEFCDTVAGANIVFTMHIKKTLFIAPFLKSFNYPVVKILRVSALGVELSSSCIIFLK